MRANRNVYDIQYIIYISICSHEIIYDMDSYSPSELIIMADFILKSRIDESENILG